MHVDIPSRAEIEQLMGVEADAALSLYLPTTPVTSDADGDRIALKTLLGRAREELAGREALLGPLEELDEDDEFWAEQARTLAIFATPEHTWLFRLPSELQESVRVAGRFDVKPLLRALTFPHAAFVLALAQGSCRLVELAADAPAMEVKVPDLPTDVASAAGKSSIKDRSPSRRLQGSEGQKILIRQYARKIDAALRHVLAGRDLPLILAAASPLAEIYRSVNSYPHLLDRGIDGNPEALGDSELAAQARAVLDEHYASELDAARRLVEERAQQGRGPVEVSDVARAATFGAVDTLLIDIDAHLAGEVDPQSGELRLADDGDQSVTEEIARRTLAAGGRVLAVRAADLPGPGPAAAVLRYAV